MGMEMSAIGRPRVVRGRAAQLMASVTSKLATNILLVGPPGTRKTQLSVGLARAAAQTRPVCWVR